MTRSTHERRGLTRLAVLCLPVAATLILPAAAIAATGTSTVIATVNGDGSVKAVKVVAANGSVNSFNGSLPVKVSISRSVSGATSTYTYHVENTFSKQQDVTYTDTSGKQHSVTTDVQLPLVARLGVQVPKTFKNVTAPNGVVQTDPDGTNRVLFSLVLFSPIGSPTQDVTFSATGRGVPTSELSATTVNPSTTSGLASASQDATASQQQADFWTGFANGGNGGLTQLADGVGKMVAGLAALAPGAHQLADGLKTAGAGATKLAVGTTAAYDGSKKLVVGTNAAHTGSGQLVAGLGKIHAGNVSLAGGLGQISGGLGQLADPATGLPAAVLGLQQIQGFMTQVIAGIGSTSDAPTASVLGALNAINLGLQGSLTNLTALSAGLKCAANTIETVVAGAAAGTTPSGCASAIPVPLAGIADPFSQAVLVGTPATPGVALQLLGASAQLDASLQPPTAANPNTLPAVIGGVQGVIHALTHPATSTTDPGGIEQVLQALNGPQGLGKVVAGLQAAVTGVDALNNGAAAAATGAGQLATGSGDALTGGQQLNSGLGQIDTGMVALSSGLGKLAAGQDQVAAGLPAAVTGSAKIADGADQLSAGAVAVHTGILAVQTGAVGPLLQQLQTGSQNAAKQVAIIEATGAMASQAPGGAGSTYVLTQSPQGFKLAAAVSVPTSSSSSSNTGRNIGIGLGGLAALVIAVAAGFALGRRSGVSA